jgi:hypothetical protein
MNTYETYLAFKNKPDESTTDAYKAKMSKNYAKNAKLAKDAEKNKDARKASYYKNLANAFDHDAFVRDFISSVTV